MRLQNFSMAGAVALVGVGLIAHSAALVFSSLGNSAQAGVGAAAPAVASAAMAQGGGEPTIVWYGVSQSGYVYTYHRLWSDGRLELRSLGWSQSTGCGFATYCGFGNWVEVTPAAGGDGFACRTDINGDRKTDAADLAQVLADWGNQGGCEPQPTYPCFDLSTPLGIQAVK